ncbi:hypothetical protein PGIGA_G00217360 [Pangasianodon gigas]|uniref:Uncharacterized protein n=1 Tax=Pangasianodon gigas TaxID=30993 RepID=A0ACC5WHR3_PANGG|nr:hypothetical protein [Pangasianodon gigas]
MFLFFTHCGVISFHLFGKTKRERWISEMGLGCQPDMLLWRQTKHSHSPLLRTMAKREGEEGVCVSVCVS